MLVSRYSLLNIRTFGLYGRHVGRFCFPCLFYCLRYVSFSAVVLLLVTALLFLLVKKARQLVSALCTSSGASFILYRKVSTIDVRKKAHPLDNDFPREAAYSKRFTLPAAHMYFHEWEGRLSRCVYKPQGRRGHFWTWLRKWKLTAAQIWR